MMEPSVEISMITMCGTVLTSAMTGLVVYLVAKINAKARVIEGKVDGQLTEVIALRDAVAFGKGEERQRDKQDMKDAVAAGIIQANGPTHEKK